MDYRRITTAVLLSSLAFTAACDDDDDDGTNPQQQYANVRVVNASSLPANASVSLFSGNTAVTSSAVAFGQASAACVQVPVGSNPLTFRTASGTDVATVTAPTGGFAANQNYTVVLFGNVGQSATTQVFADPVLTASANNNQLRFINATNTAGNVYVTAPNATITATTTPSASNIAPGTASSFGTGTTASAFGTFPTANTSVRLFNTNATTFTNPRVNFTIGSSALNANRVGTVILTEATTGTPAANASFVVQPCS